MKQIEEMFGRFITDKRPLKKKWQMRIVLMGTQRFLFFFHYHHVIAAYDVDGKIVHSWYETKTDQRGLNEIMKYMLSDARGLVLKTVKEGRMNYEVPVIDNRSVTAGNVGRIANAIR